jgi:hypothetical protein
MDLKRDQRQNIQKKLDFSSEQTGEARKSRKGRDRIAICRHCCRHVPTFSLCLVVPKQATLPVVENYGHRQYSFVDSDTRAIDRQLQTAL